MKKLALVLVVAAATVFAANAEPLGIDVGADVGISGLAAGDIGTSFSPWVGYGMDLAGLAPYFTLGYDATVSPDYSADDVYLDIGLSKSFALSDALTIDGSLAITNTINIADDNSYALDLEPGASVAAGKLTTSLSLPMGIINSAEEFTLGLNVTEGVSMGDLGLEAYVDFSVSPEFSFDDVGVAASYPVAGIGLGADFCFSGFDADLAVDLTLSASYSF